MHPVVTCLLGGILPFGACFVEMFFIMSSVWMDQYYYVFGFLLVVFVILAVTCAEITIVLCYFQLCAEDYHWWWRSFMTSGELVLNEVFFFYLTNGGKFPFVFLNCKVLTFQCCLSL
jgi:transmembrane 9 superfamily member 2/4